MVSSDDSKSSPRWHDAFIALGSNLGRRKKNIAAALNALESTRDIEVLKVSPLYETEPEGGPAGQPPFINGVVQIRTTLAPNRLLAVCQRIEGLLGRQREIHWGPRTIDLDLLSFDVEICSDSNLTLPHPMMHERAFVIQPLADIAPDWVHPVLQQTASTLLESLGRRDWVRDPDE
ncbi:MAG TPA: 2-amino-4-hydroxy-6-hydroxymethyldihydropteridine diphosphokinase [Phycisphaerae bacterium]|nr:2-amino-4-hydroxy-6-hydroxymethyldihydropteridine diphosphokinase [Phycisphaerae bacterium]